jgi:hypothetical protein
VAYSWNGTCDGCRRTSELQQVTLPPRSIWLCHGCRGDGVRLRRAIDRAGGPPAWFMVLFGAALGAGVSLTVEHVVRFYL